MADLSVLCGPVRVANVAETAHAGILSITTTAGQLTYTKTFTNTSIARATTRVLLTPINAAGAAFWGSINDVSLTNNGTLSVEYITTPTSGDPKYYFFFFNGGTLYTLT